MCTERWVDLDVENLLEWASDFRPGLGGCSKRVRFGCCFFADFRLMSSLLTNVSCNASRMRSLYWWPSLCAAGKHA